MKRITLAEMVQLSNADKRVFEDYYITECYPNTSLSHARFKQCRFHEGDLSGTDFSGVQMEHVQFEYLTMHRINLSRALLRQCSFVGDIDLTQAQCRSADLKEIVLQGANLEGADFTLANLEHAQLQRAVCFRARFHQARLSSANFRQADIRSALFGSGKDCFLGQPYRTEKPVTALTPFIAAITCEKALQREPTKDGNLSREIAAKRL